MLAGVEQGPRRRGEADGANVEVRHAGASLRKYTVHPGQIAAARGWVDLPYFALEKLLRQAVKLHDDDALDLGVQRDGIQRNRQEQDRRQPRRRVPHHCSLPSSPAEACTASPPRK